MGTRAGRAGKTLNRGISGREFVMRAAVVTAGIIIVLFAANIWIVEPLTSSKRESLTAAEYKGPKKDFGKKNKINIKWKAAGRHVGEYVVTQGRIVSTKDTGKVCYLNFDRNYKETLSLVIFAGDYDRFPEKPDRYFLGKNIKVEGRIKEYKGRIEIIVRTMDQIKITNNYYRLINKQRQR